MLGFVGDRPDLNLYTTYSAAISPHFHSRSGDSLFLSRFHHGLLLFHIYFICGAAGCGLQKSAPKFCCGCEYDVSQEKVSSVLKRQVFDIPEPKIEVTEHRVEVK